MALVSFFEKKLVHCVYLRTYCSVISRSSLDLEKGFLCSTSQIPKIEMI